ncbi:tatD-related DNAse [Tieghemostelium lacteum]|uniref:TatD-related DNAse n=1 Tax=Tieghemostelium lacteum TaxID=361077 RepID=A0A152A5Q8_TIELA|nr:tatD-related DNAse [Tieghemostelium lacteum]|eukprot:KYR01431.1 tatD-related DNAse [Tieghemostelium lacteum]
MDKKPQFTYVKKNTTTTTNNSNSNNNNHYNNTPKQQGGPKSIPKVLPNPIDNSLETIDIGANLADKQFIVDQDDILKRSFEKGVKTIVITGTSINSSIRAFDLIRKKKSDVFPELFSTCGVHPHEAEETMKRLNGSDGAIKELRRLIESNRDIVRAVGECGLDFNRNFSSHETQIEMFSKQIQLAVDLQLPLFIHERDAHQKFLEIVGKFTGAGVMPKSVVHCFTGTEQEAKTYIDSGFYLGFTGFVAHKTRGEELRQIISKGIIPIDKIMIETDAPYMGYFNIHPNDMPPKSAKISKGRNEPSYLPYILRTLSECYKLPELEISIQLLKNTREFFNLIKK